MVRKRQSHRICYVVLGGIMVLSFLGLILFAQSTMIAMLMVGALFAAMCAAGGLGMMADSEYRMRSTRVGMVRARARWPEAYDDVERRESRSFEGFAYEEVDTAEIRRVVTDRSSGKEVIVCGTADTTFRQAALDYWDFDIDRDSDWLVEDDRGNDISDTPLGSYGGLAFLAVRGMGASGTDRSPGSRGIDAGVEFYD
ncbi:MAG: hypothetical protein ACTSUU_00035 [Candidatus Thorarchaeota archaeon]